MDRRAFLTGTGAVLLAAPLAAEAQQPESPPRIGFLPVGSPSDPITLALIDAFRRGLRDAGRVENRDYALVLWPRPFLYTHSLALMDFVRARRLPLLASSKEYVELGALMSYGIDRRALFRETATYVGKILNGAQPADLSVERPATFELVISLRTAKNLGLTIPSSLLLRADQVIQ